MRGWRVEAVPVHILYHDLVRQADAEGKLRVEREGGGERLLGEHGRMARIVGTTAVPSVPWMLPDGGRST